MVFPHLGIRYETGGALSWLTCAYLCMGVGTRLGKSVQHRSDGSNVNTDITCGRGVVPLVNMYTSLNILQWFIWGHRIYWAAWKFMEIPHVTLSSQQITPSSPRIPIIRPSLGQSFGQGVEIS